MRKLIFAISALALATSASLADPQEEREVLMKANGAAMGALAAIVKGEKRFDAEVVLSALTKLKEDAEKLDPAVLWPVGSATDDSESSPKIWEDPAGFQAKIDKFRADTASAASQPPTDVDSLKATVGAIGSNCASCHESFRIKKG